MDTQEAHKKAEELFPYSDTEASQITDKLRNAFLLGFGIGNEKINNTIRIHKYWCEVEFSCSRIDSLKSMIISNVSKKTNKDRMLESLEEIRTTNSNLRDWGHDLRRKLIKVYKIFDEIEDI